MADMDLLKEGLDRYRIEVPHNVKQSNGFIRWGKNNRYWAKEVGEGYIYGDHVNDLQSYIFPNNKKPDEKTMQEIELKKQENAEENKQRQEVAAKESCRTWKNLPSATNDHPYLVKKKVDVGGGVKINNRSELVIPLIDINGKISTLQFIDTEGNKKFFPGGKKQGCFYPTRRIEDNSETTIYICEGYATGMSLDKVLDAPIIVSFDAGNLEPVAIKLRIEYPDAEIIICADNDLENEINIGLQKAYEAAMAIDNARVIYPLFVDENGRNVECCVDFNDVYCIGKTEEIRGGITKAISKEGGAVKCNSKNILM